MVFEGGWVELDDGSMERVDASRVVKGEGREGGRLTRLGVALQKSKVVGEE